MVTVVNIHNAQAQRQMFRHKDGYQGSKEVAQYFQPHERELMANSKNNQELTPGQLLAGAMPHSGRLSFEPNSHI